MKQPQNHDESALQHAPEQHTLPSHHDGVGDHAATVIAAMEAKLAEVQRLSAESSRRAAELDSREVELVKTRLDIETQRRTIGEQRREIETLRSRIAAEQQEHDERLKALEADLGASRQSLDSDRAALESQRAEFGERAASIEQQGRQIEEQRGAIEARATQLDAVERESRERSERTEKLAAETTRLRQELDSARAGLDEQRKGLDHRAAELASLDAELKRRQTELAQREQQLAGAEQIEQALRSQQATLKSAQEQLSERAKAVEARAAALAEREAALAKIEHETAELSRQAKQRLEQAAEQLRMAEERAEHADEQVSLAEAKLSAAGQSAQQAVAGRVEMHEKLVAAEKAQKEAVHRANELEQEMAKVRASSGADHAARAELQARFEALSAEAERFSKKPDAAESELAETKARFEETLKQAAAQKKDLDAAIKRLSGNKLASEFEELKKTLAAREETLRQVAQRLMAAEQQLGNRPAASDDEPNETQTEHEGDMSPREPADMTGFEELLEKVRSRHRRLKVYKQLLGAQSRKIMQAKAAMQRKAEQYDQVIAQRAKISEAAASLELEKQKVQAKAAKGGAALVTFCIFATIAIIGALGWAIAGQVAPATFAARATLVADAKGRELTRDEALAWTEGMEKLTEDPALAQLAAERFSQRGMVGLATVGAVRDHFKQNMTLFTDRAGELTFELRSPGSERAARELETFVIAATAMANQQRETRADGAGALLKDPVKAGNEPLADQRLLYVAGIGGGGTIIALLIGAVIFRFLAKAKANFERESAALAAF